MFHNIMYNYPQTFYNNPQSGTVRNAIHYGHRSIRIIWAKDNNIKLQDFEGTTSSQAGPGKKDRQNDVIELNNSSYTKASNRAM